MNKVLILTGPGGSGKSTIANLLVEKCEFVKIDGDELDGKFFPKGEQWLPKNLNNLRRAHDAILKETKKFFKQGKNIVLDYIIFGDYINFFKEFKKEFGKNLEIKVLFPSEEEMIRRDKERACWTTGEERISTVRKEFENIRKFIGKKNFIDSTGQKPEETLQKYFNF
ncbi:MAG: AAA family ATPase [Candidatus Portnoybacteria bacterium]|nr:AAA family ATPase [Candidatus Portnoybacteria bacterium]